MPAGVGHRFRIHVAQSEDVAMKSDFSSTTHLPIDPEFDDLLHPAQAFEHPRDVVHDPDLTLNEKRAILASWASDACAVKAVPALRLPPGVPQVMAIDEILDALRALDKAAQSETPQAAWARRQVRRRAFSEFWRPTSGSNLVL
jgi:hypothetical protein